MTTYSPLSKTYSTQEVKIAKVSLLVHAFLKKNSLFKLSAAEFINTQPRNGFIEVEFEGEKFGITISPQD